MSLVETAGQRRRSLALRLRAGVAHGQALGRGGDWYGRPVNLAARITNFARPDSVVVAEGSRTAIECADVDCVQVLVRGQRHFKGIEGEVPVHRVRRAEDREP